MAVKLSSFVFSKKIPQWVNWSACYLSSSCAQNILLIPETDHNSANIGNFEEKIQFLRNDLYSDNSIQVLDNTNELDSAVKLFKWASLQKRFRHSAATYYHIILKLGLAGKVEEVEAFCQTVLKDRCPGVKDVFISLIDSFVRHCRLKEAIRVLVNMNSGDGKPPIDTCNVVLSALVREKKDFQDILFVYKEMVKAGIATNVDTLNCLLEVLFETGQIETALDQFKRMHRKGCSANSRTFEIVIKGLILNRRVDDSVVILHEMFKLQFRPELGFFTCLIPLFCGQHRLEEGIQLFAMMRDLSYVPNLLVYRELIKCLCHDLFIDNATKILEDMIEVGVRADANVFVDIIRAFCNVGKLNEAINFLEDKCSGVTSAHIALLEGCCNAGRFFMAISLLEKVSERNITDCDSWNILVRWLCKNLELRRAYELLGRMIVSSVVPDSATYSALVIGNCRLRKYKDALDLYHFLHGRCQVLDATSYSELIEGLCQMVKLREVIEIVNYMSKNGCCLQPASFTIVIKSICDAGKVDEAIRLCLLAYNSGTSCTNATYNAIMLEFCKSGRIGDLLAVLSQRLVQGCSLDMEAYCILIRSMSSGNRSKDCALLFNMMVNKGLVPDSETTHSLLFCLADHSQLHLALEAIKKLLCNTKILDSRMYNMLINGLWKECCKSEASRLLDLMLEKGWVPDGTTHGLFVGSSLTAERESVLLACEHSTSQDNVSNILADALGET